MSSTKNRIILGLSVVCANRALLTKLQVLRRIVIRFIILLLVVDIRWKVVLWNDEARIGTRKCVVNLF